MDVVASLDSELKDRVQKTLYHPTPEAMRLLSTWMQETFRVHSAKTPKGMKPLKEQVKRFIDNLAYFGAPGVWIAPGVTSMLERSWKDIEPQTSDLVLWFSAEGDKTRGREEITELSLSHGTYANRSGMSNDNFRKYAESVDRVLASLSGWRAKALKGELKIAFVGKQEMKVQGKYKTAQDTLLVRATPQVLSRSSGYGTVDYIIVHELGHRYERFNPLPTDFDRNVTWRTSRYSYSDGEAFAELFAIGHFDIKGSWDEGKVEKFERLMSGQERLASSFERKLRRF